MKLSEKTKFALTIGVLRWGLLTTIISVLVEITLGEIHSLTQFIGKSLISLICFSISGYFFGLYMWTVKQGCDKKL